MIETKGLRKSFRSRAGRETKTVDAVRGVDLDVAEGEIFGFLGPNGAGKTTTLRMLATLIEPDGGEATIAGADLRKDPAEVRRRIGYVAQGGSTWDESTAREELVLQARMYGISKAEAQRRAAARAGRLPAHRVRRPQVQDLLRRPAPPGRHRARHHPRAEGGLPGRADHRPRPAEPRPHVGRDPPAARRGHDGLPHHALPRRGRRALRPDRDHGPRRDRRRGHAGRAQARDLRRRGARRARPAATPQAAAGCSTASRTSTSWRPSTRAACGCTSTTARPPSRRSCARSTTPGIALRSIELHRPSLDDVFLTKTGRSLRES